jgi:hypothetical protein
MPLDIPGDFMNQAIANDVEDSCHTAINGADSFQERDELTVSCKDESTCLFVCTLIGAGLNRPDAVVKMFNDLGVRSRLLTINTPYRAHRHAAEIKSFLAKVVNSVEQNKNNDPDYAVAVAEKDWLAGLRNDDRPFLVEGDTAIHLAARFGSDLTVAALLHAGADDFLVNSQGETPLEVAAAGGLDGALTWKLINSARTARTMGRSHLAIAEVWLRGGSQRAQAPNPIIVTTSQRRETDAEALGSDT